MDKSVKGKPTGFGLSKVAKKRIAGIISIIIFAVLLMSLTPSERILGTWEFNKPVRGEGEDIIIYRFEEDGLGRIYNKTSPEAAPHNIRDFGYALDDSKLIIIEDGLEKVYDYSFTFNKLYFNDAGDNSLDYTGSFSPLLKYFLVIILALLILWCFEDDLNVFLRAEGRWRKSLSNMKRRIFAGIAFVICIVFLLLTFIPSIRLAGTWKADVHYNTDEKMPERNTTATYTFNSDNTGRYYNEFKNGDVADEKFEYTREDVLSIVFTNDTAVPNVAYILSDHPEIKVPGSYNVKNANIVRKDVRSNSDTYSEVVFEDVTYVFGDNDDGYLKINKAHAVIPETDYAPAKTIVFEGDISDKETNTHLSEDERKLFKDIKFKEQTVDTDLVLTFKNEAGVETKEIYEYAFWFDTLFLDRVGDGDNNTYDCQYTIDTWFSPTFKLIIAGISLLIALYFMSVDFTEHKKAKEDKKKLKEALKAKKKIAEK